MALKVVTRTLDFTIRDLKSDRPQPSLVAECASAAAHPLRAVLLLAGEDRPILAPLRSTPVDDSEDYVYRYDWVFGLTCLKPELAWWDWQAELRSESAVTVQLIIRCPPGVIYSESAAGLLALSPSRDARSWLERNREALGKVMSSTADMAGVLSQPVSKALKLASSLSNFVDSGEGPTKRWFVYRFLDVDTTSCAIEWRMHKPVLREFGPVLRGTIALSFHGVASLDEPVELILRPKLGFYPSDDICYVTPTDALPPEQRPTLSITPIAAVTA